jgi:hypothetical protein
MLLLLLTYQDNIPFAEETQRVLKEKWDLDAEIIIGYMINNEKYTRTNVIMEAWVDLVIPRALSSDEEMIMILDDDVRFVRDPREIDYYADVNWIGFRRGRLTNKKPVITGSQAVVFRRDVLPLIYDNFVIKKKKVHLDRGLSKVLKQFENKIKIHQPKLSYCYEQEHTSLISLDKWSQYTTPPS